ncbi:uncharacterized protein VTP21DRAFT_10308 [Calcarisporiella thermophila]|uniref:uncharacterized protein n=1 Tax=Calcarisporiella thermophila TaxID=911321 RepID=UPI003743082B
MSSGQKYNKGDRVEYRPVEGGMQTTTGQIVDILTEPDVAGERGQTLKASEQEPRYVIRNDNTQKETGYFSSAIERKLE